MQTVGTTAFYQSHCCKYCILFYLDISSISVSGHVFLAWDTFHILLRIVLFDALCMTRLDRFIACAIGLFHCVLRSYDCISDDVYACLILPSPADMAFSTRCYGFHTLMFSSLMSDASLIPITYSPPQTTWRRMPYAVLWVTCMAISVHLPMSLAFKYAMLSALEHLGYISFHLLWYLRIWRWINCRSGI
jgi:hypothetical protein